MAETIGIKIANGEFYPIIEGNIKSKKRLVLTTVHNKQQSVQIDLYKSEAKTMADALYIGSLVVENIKPKPKGDPSIEMIISSTESGEISAEAIDLDTSAGGQHQYLNVSLKSLDEDNRDYELPDFELEQNEDPPIGLYERARTMKKKENTFPWLAVIIVSVLIIGLCLALWFFFIRDKGSSGIPPAVSPPAVSVQPPAPPAPVPAQPPAPAPVPASPPAAAPAQAPSAPQPAVPARPEVPVIAAPARPRAPAAAPRTRPPAPVSSYKVPGTIPRNGAAYKIRWGDTLWDIAEAFYRNPWLYPRIARYNGIKNPDLIVSGRTIRIPPKN